MSGHRRPGASSLLNPCWGPLNLMPWLSQIDGVFCGGETGATERALHPAWATYLRDQCQETNTAFFFKNWGTWKPPSHLEARYAWVILPDGSVWPRQEAGDHPGAMPITRGRTGIKDLVDGKRYREVPGFTSLTQAPQIAGTMHEPFPEAV